MATVRMCDCQPAECEETEPASGPRDAPTHDADVLQRKSCDDDVSTVQVSSPTPPAEPERSESPDDVPGTDGRITSSVPESTTAHHRQCATDLKRGAALKQIVSELNEEVTAIGVGVTFPTIPSFRSARDMVRTPIDSISL
jgi:hypothetical protein